MVVWLWALVGILTLIVIAALTKIHILRKAAREIEEAFADRLQTSTNTPIGISCNDRYMRSLAAAINTQLRRLRSERHRFQQGDTELKNAVTNIWTCWSRWRSRMMSSVISTSSGTAPKC